MPALMFPFLIVVAVLTVTPGPDMALVLRNGVRGGPSVAWWTGLGCCLGIAVHALAAVAGLSALLAASAAAFAVVRLAGAAYLVYLGVSALWHTRRRASRPAPAEPAEPAVPVASSPGAAVSRAAAFRQGLLSNLLNPKIVLIFLTLLPQFVADGEPRLATTAVLAGVFLATAVLWWRLFSLLVGALGRVLSRERVRRVFDRVTGTVLVGLGLRMAVEHG
ncbi:LysE family translocator [Actinomadura logoneensis]|uniref:LysE family translocator n=1 Tax=Actinomadura logoneensis TaxID=2293572 RepID=A0A372JDT7_9ACTN|nr:LysE family translocator [Actinomadura logoneensis]RFU38171.1 LysE family translocator [Actinomadura logoneensis]